MRMLSELTYLDSVISHEPKGDSTARLLIVEDAGTLLGEDGHRVAAEALSRLLNLSDGLLGQACPLLIALTSNLPLIKLAAPLTRPGRSMAVINVAELTAAESSVWLGRRVAEPMTLAELYALRDASPVAETPAPMEAATGHYL